jgi:hypothetical protein
MRALFLTGVGFVGVVSWGWAAPQASFCPRVDLRIGSSISADWAVAADINGDGLDEVITGGYFGTIAVFRHAGGGVFEKQQQIQLPLTWSSEGIACEDLDGDLDTDVVVTSSQNGLFILQNQMGALSLVQNWPGDPQRSIRAVDTTGDGLPELIVGMSLVPPPAGMSVSVLTNLGGFTFSQGPVISFQWPPTVYVLDATAADVDNDGDADLVFGASPDVAVALNDGSGGFSPHTLFQALSESQQLVVAHLNADSFLDLASVSANAAGTGTVSVLVNKGTNAGSWLGFDAPMVLPVGKVALGVAALDVDGDLDLDLACSDHSAGEVAILLNDGTAGFTATVRLATPDCPYRLFAADVTGDGVADLLGGRRHQYFPKPDEVTAYIYPVRTDDRISVLFDSTGLAVKESGGAVHMATASLLGQTERGTLLATLQGIFDDVFGGGAVSVEEGSGGCIHSVISSGTSRSGVFYGNAGAEDQPVLVYEGQFRANPAFVSEDELARAMAETLAHEIGHKLGVQGHNCDDPPSLDLMTCGEKVTPAVRKLGQRLFNAVDKTRMSLNLPLVSGEPKSNADPNDLAILNGAFCVPPQLVPDDSYLSLKANLTSNMSTQFGYINSFGEFVYQCDSSNPLVIMGSHFDGGFDLAARIGGPTGPVYSFSNGGGCFTLNTPNPNNPAVFLSAQVSFPAIGASVTLDVENAMNITGGLLLPPQAGTCGIFCTAKTALVCGPPSIAATGVPSATATSGFTISAGPARTCKSGILLYNQGQAPATSFQGGTLCLESMGLRRAGSTSSMGTPGGANCDGQFSIDMNAFASGQWVVPACDGSPSGFPSSSPAGFLTTVGAAVGTQFWGRDSQGTGSFVSNGLEYVVGP